MLAVDATLVCVSLATAAPEGRGGRWAWTILGVIVGAFLAQQAWRAHREVCADAEP